VQDNGTCLSLVPSRVINPRLIPFTIIAVIWAVGAFVYLPLHRRPTTPLWASRIFVGTFVSFGLTVFYFCLRSPNRDRRPWITVDREAKRILLPRSRRSFSFAEVVRLQLVCFSRLGAFAEATGTGKKPPDGELQIVFHESGKEQAGCVVSGLYAPAAKQFSVAFRQITGVPVSRAIYHPALGEWQVEPLDGDWDSSALDALTGSARPAAR
jgi:hypothetical protein